MAVLASNMKQQSTKQQMKKNSMLLVQDLSYTRNLSANDDKVRRKSLKYLKNYLSQRSKSRSLTAKNFKVLWKGLFYSMWMSDKPLVQEECAESIAHLIHSLQFPEAMQFYKFGMITLQNEWIGIDQLRLDKFLMFLRRLLRQALLALQKKNFKKQYNLSLAKVLEETILSTSLSAPLGLFMHFTEIYLEELAKVSEGKLQSNRTLDLLQPFIHKLSFSNDNRIIQWITKFIFTHLMKQHKLGLEYEEKYKVWKKEGFVGSINQVQKVIVDEDFQEDNAEEELNDSTTEKPLDPRAGKVDVELPQILFNAKEISEALLVPKSEAKTTKTSRKHLTLWSEKFMKLHNGIYPLGLKTLESKRKVMSFDTNITKAAKRLTKFEQRLIAKNGDSRKRKREHNINQYDEAVEINKKKTKLTSIGKTSDEEHRIKVENKEETSKQNLVNSKKSKKGTKIANDKCCVEELHLEKTLHISEKLNYSKDVEHSFSFERNSGVWLVTSFDSNQICTDPKHARIKKCIDSTVESTAHTGTEIVLASKQVEKKLKDDKSTDAAEQIFNKLRGKNTTARTEMTTNSQSTVTTKQKRNIGDTSKKVVINTKLNVSQEIDDHIERVKASPQIPWDSSRKPGKPLLKSPLKCSPVNPFYKLNTF